MNTIFCSQSTIAAAAPGSVCSQNVSPSSTPYITCSMWPVGDSSSAVVDVPGLRPSKYCVVSACSQVSRSGPVIVTTSRCDRSTNAWPATRARCSRRSDP